jgi:hypothetical protein
MDRDEHGARNIAISTMSRMRRQQQQQPFFSGTTK